MLGFRNMPWIRRMDPAETVAVGRWENEGGAAPASPSDVAMRRIESESATRATSDALDKRQYDLMTIASSDGRPPPRWQRIIVWRWFGVGATALIAVIVIALAITGVSIGAVVAGGALGILFLVGAIPVLAAGALRGGEERAARKQARAERQVSRSR